jgi:DNA replication and repair protein RecF
VFSAEARAIGDEGLEASLAYRSGIIGDDDDDDDDAAPGDGGDDGGLRLEPAALRGRLEERLARGRAIERRKRSTLCGPQHDDLRITKGDRPARFLASQGEARALVLALKLAAVRVQAEGRGAPPLLLLDDVAGELDRHRAGRLLMAIDETGAQCFVTTTSTSTLPPLGDAAVHVVEGGRLRGAG